MKRGRPGELPYFGPLMKLPRDFIDINLAFSRVSGEPKRYAQDLIRERGDAVAGMLADPDCCIYVCGLKGMEQGVHDASGDVCAAHGMNWEKTLPDLVAQSRYHVETY